MLRFPVYLDNNATTPVDEKVLQAMLPYFKDKFGNAASTTHAYGWVAAEAIENASMQVASLIGSLPEEIIFTSGATESVNLALKGACEAYVRKGNHIITVSTEHKAVLDTLQFLGKKGIKVDFLPVSREGLIDLDALEAAITDQTILIAVMAANNETGVLQPVELIGEMARQKGVLFFCDATQAAGKIRVDINEIKADLLCFSAHKMYGPKGTGAIFIRRKNPKVKLIPLIHGGGHQNGMRSGTLNVPGIVGFGEACKHAQQNWWNISAALSPLRTRLEQHVIDSGHAFINGSVKSRLPNTTNLHFKGINSIDLIKQLPELAFSSGSACSSADPAPSHVLQAMGLSSDETASSVRFSLGKNNTAEEIDFAIDKISQMMKKLR